jgi:hypothetical protein
MLPSCCFDSVHDFALQTETSFYKHMFIDLRADAVQGVSITYIQFNKITRSIKRLKREERKREHTVIYVCDCRRGFGLDIGFTANLYTPLITTVNRHRTL